MRSVLVLMSVLIATVCCSVYGQSSAGSGECLDANRNACSNGGNQLSIGSTAPGLNPRAATAAAAINATQNNLRRNTEAINNAGDKILGILRQRNSAANPSPQENGNDGSARPTDKAARQQSNYDATAQAPTSVARGPQRQNDEAAALLQSASDDMATASGGSSGTSAPQSPNAVLTSLLTSGSPSKPGSVNAGLNSLLSGAGDSAPSGSDANQVLSKLLNQSTMSGSSSAFPIPSNPMMNAALEISADQPDRGATAPASLSQMLQSTSQNVQDSLSRLVNSGKELISSLTNDRVVQWAVSDSGNMTTAPLPVASDSPDAVADLAAAQATVGLSDLLKGMAVGPVGLAKGVYNYGSKMVNQMGADLGFADANIFGTQTGNSQ